MGFEVSKQQKAALTPKELESMGWQLFQTGVAVEIAARSAREVGRRSRQLLNKK